MVATGLAQIASIPRSWRILRVARRTALYLDLIVGQKRCLNRLLAAQSIFKSSPRRIVEPDLLLAHRVVQPVPPSCRNDKSLNLVLGGRHPCHNCRLLYSMPSVPLTKVTESHPSDIFVAFSSDKIRHEH